jgi:trigger factor
MKVAYTDVSDTQKSLQVEIDPDVVGTEIDRVIRGYARSLKLPGFRPGKIPPKIIRQRFKAQILHDVAHDLIPRAVEDALRERGVEPIETPAVKDVSIEEGQPLTFTAAFQTAPPVDPGSYASLTIRRPAIEVTNEQIEEAMGRLAQSAARFQPVTDRAAETGDTVVMNLTRTQVALPVPAEGDEETAAAEAAPVEPERLEEAGVEIGAPANPPGFDEHLLGVSPGTEKSFRVTFPADYGVESLAGRELDYAIEVTGIRRKHVPALDDEFAKDLGYDALDKLRERVAENLKREAARNQERNVRQELLQQLAQRVPFEAPDVLVAREVDRRVEEFVHQLIEQRIDPMRAQIDWEQFRTEQRDPAVNTVKCMLILDEIARREHLTVTDEELDGELEKFAASANQPIDTVRARLEKEGAIGRVYAGLRREKAIDFALGNATVLEA